MAEKHDCIYEEQIQGQSRVIERIEAELMFKKEKLDDLKEDNKRMEEKIDSICDSVNKLIRQSDSKDSQLEIRLTAIEQRQKDIENKRLEDKKESNNRTNRLLVAFGLGLTCITILLDIAFHFLG